MERVMNDRDFYRELLQGFLATDDLAFVKSAWNAKEYTALLERVHSLKGVASNFGLNKLLEAVIQLEDALHDSGDTVAEYQQFLASYEKTNRAIEQFLRVDRAGNEKLDP